MVFSMFALFNRMIAPLIINDKGNPLVLRSQKMIKTQGNMYYDSNNQNDQYFDGLVSIIQILIVSFYNFNAFKIFTFIQEKGDEKNDSYPLQT